jgi:hypothetical protein
MAITVTILYPLGIWWAALTDSRWLNCTHHLTINCMAVPIRWYGVQPYGLHHPVELVQVHDAPLAPCTFKHEKARLHFPYYVNFICSKVHHLQINKNTGIASYEELKLPESHMSL